MMDDNRNWEEIVKGDIEKTKKLEIQFIELLLEVEELRNQAITDEKQKQFDNVIEIIKKELDKVRKINDDQSEILCNLK